MRLDEPQPPGDLDRVLSSDVHLIKRAQEGDVAAFEALVGLHRDRVFSLAARMLRSDADAAEVTQDAFIAAYRNLKDFRGDAAFGSWVHRIAANYALMRLRHRKVAREVEDLPQPNFNERGSLLDQVADWAPTAEGLTLDAELRGAIDSAANALPDDYREVFVLRDLEGLSYDEIATATGQSLASVKTRLHRARLALRTAIDQFYKEREA